MTRLLPLLALLLIALSQLATVPAGAQTQTYALTPSVTAAEGTDAELTVTLGRAAPPGGLSFSVSYDYSGGGTEAADTGATPSTVRVAAGRRTATLTVPIAADTKLDAGETFTVTIAPAGGVTGWSVAPGGTATSTVTITDSAARVTFGAASYRFKEGDPRIQPLRGPAVRTTQLEASWHARSFVGQSDVEYVWAGGTAQGGGIDFRPVDRRFVADPFRECANGRLRRCGSLANTVVFTRTLSPGFDVIDDRLVEDEETFTVTLRPPAGWSTTPHAVATVTIEDNDAAKAKIAFGTDAGATAKYAASVAENVSGGTLAVPVTVSHLPGSSTTFGIEVLAEGTASEGTDYSIATKSVMFGPDDASKTKNVTVAIIDDTDREPGETIELRIVPADRVVDDLGDHYARNRNGSRATLTVTNDDIPPPAFDPDGSATVTEPATDITLTFGFAVRKDAGGGDFAGADLQRVLALKAGGAGGTDIPFTASIDQARKVVTIDPAPDLPDGTVYAAISDGWFDTAGVRGSAASVTFTVDATAPSPTFSPVDGATVADPTTNVTLTFGEPVRKDSAGGAFSGADLTRILTLKRTDANGADIPFAATIDAAGTTITVDPVSNLAGGAVYAAISDRYFDAAGNQGRAGSATFTVEAALPSNLRVTEGNTRLDLAWTAPTETFTGHDVH